MKSVADGKGYAVIGFLLVAIIILSAALAVQTAACVTVNKTSAAFDVAKQNAVFLSRLERAAGEAAQSSFGQNLDRNPEAFSQRLTEVLAAAPLGSVELEPPALGHVPEVPRAFPNWRGAPSTLEAPSDELKLISGARTQQYMGSVVSESEAWKIGFRFSRIGEERDLEYDAEVECRFVSVPLTRFPVCLYDLPGEIGEGSDHAVWPHGLTADDMAPRGLVSSRDGATATESNTKMTRPASYRKAAVLAEAYQYLFSNTYLRGLSDFVGTTHFVQIGGGSTNPKLSGGIEHGSTYSLDLGLFGEGKYASRTATRNAAVIVGLHAGDRVTLSDTDSGSIRAEPILIAMVGSAQEDAEPLRVEISAELRRPVILIFYHCQLEGIAAPSVNGAILCDPACSVNPTTERILTGHLSWWGGAPAAVEHFEISKMPIQAALLAPRVVHVVTQSRLL